MGHLTVESRGIFKLNIRYQEGDGQAFCISSVSKYPLMGRLFKLLGLACAMKLDKKVYYVNIKSFLKHAKKVDQIKTDGLTRKKIKKINSAFIGAMIKAPESLTSVHLHLGPIVIVSNPEIAKKIDEGKIEEEGMLPPLPEPSVSDLTEKEEHSPEVHEEDVVEDVLPVIEETKEVSQRREQLLKTALELCQDDDLFFENSSPEKSEEHQTLLETPERVETPEAFEDSLFNDRIVLQGGYTFTGTYEKESGSGSHYDQFSNQIVDPLPASDFFEEESVFDAEAFFTQNDSWKFHKSAKATDANSEMPSDISEADLSIQKGKVDLDGDEFFDGYYLVDDEGNIEFKVGTYRSNDYSWVYDGGWNEGAFTGYLYQTDPDFKRSEFIRGALHKEMFYEGDDIEIVQLYADRMSKINEKGDLLFAKAYDRKTKKLLEVTYYKDGQEKYRLSGSFNESTKLEGFGSETIYSPMPLKYRGEFRNGVKQGEFRVIHREKGLLVIVNYDQNKIENIELGPFDEEGNVIGEGRVISFEEIDNYLKENRDKIIEDDEEKRCFEVLDMVF